MQGDLIDLTSPLAGCLKALPLLRQTGDSDDLSERPLLLDPAPVLSKPPFVKPAAATISLLDDIFDPKDQPSAQEPGPDAASAAASASTAAEPATAGTIASWLDDLAGNGPSQGTTMQSAQPEVQASCAEDVEMEDCTATLQQDAFGTPIMGVLQEEAGAAPEQDPCDPSPLEPRQLVLDAEPPAAPASIPETLVTEQECTLTITKAQGTSAAPSSRSDPAEVQEAASTQGPAAEQPSAVQEGPGAGTTSSTQPVADVPADSASSKEVAELRLKLTKVEASRDALARELGTLKATIGKLEGNVASKEKMVKQQGDELVNLRTMLTAAQQDAATARRKAEVTPERCRESARSLQLEAAKAAEAARAQEAKARKLNEVLEYEEEEMKVLQEFFNQERAALLATQAEAAAALAAEKDAAAKARWELQGANARIEELQAELHASRKEVYEAKGRNIELCAEVTDMRKQAAAAQQAVEVARAQVVAAEEGRGRTEAELAEVREAGVKLFKQIRAVAHAFERHIHHLQKVNEVVLSIRQLQEWCAKQAPFWAATASAAAAAAAAAAAGPQQGSTGSEGGAAQQQPQQSQGQGQATSVSQSLPSLPGRHGAGSLHSSAGGAPPVNSSLAIGQEDMTMSLSHFMAAAAAAAAPKADHAS